MTENTPSFGTSEQDPAVKANGFVDYYELIHEDPESTVTRLRTAINNLYNEAQANRDHRNLNKRRSYQTLLQYLPEARELLLDEDIRHKYNIYREESLDGIAKQSFDEWKKATLNKGDDMEHASLLGVQEEQQRLRGQEVRAQVLTVPKEKTPRSRVAVDENASKPTSATPPALMGSALSAIVFFVVLVLVKFILHRSFPTAIIIGAILAIIVWFVSHQNKGKTTV